jgi:hypothetical protein
MPARPDANDLDVHGYAAVCARLADGARPREEILGELGFDEASWTEADAVWQDRLSSALDQDVEGVPELIAAYAEAFARARAVAAQGAVIEPIERFAQATREIQRLGDPMKALGRVGMTLEQFLRANEHWTRRMIEEPEVAERFRKVLGL